FMTRAELEHAIRAACEVADDDAVWIFGSQAIVGQYPNAPEEIRLSMEVDLCPVNHPERADQIYGAIGEESDFHRAHGFWVHGFPVDDLVLPEGWRERVVEVRNANTNGKTGRCVEVHDLAAGKLHAFREKDRRFVREVLGHGLARVDVLQTSIRRLPVQEDRRADLLRWLRATVDELRETGD
ncbi:MAG: hypothetical protein ACOC5E_03695, partial [Acidobacteriota bacterium]